MRTTYWLECWDITSRMYLVWWHGHDEERARIQMRKPYYPHTKRRIVKTTMEVIATKEGERKRRRA